MTAWARLVSNQRPLACEAVALSKQAQLDARRETALRHGVGMGPISPLAASGVGLRPAAYLAYEPRTTTTNQRRSR